MATRDPSPRVKLATRLWASGIVKTKNEAAEAAGIHPSYFSVVSSDGSQRRMPGVSKLIDEIDQAIHDKTIQTTVLLELIGREALSEMRKLMSVDNIAIKFKATQDLLDRSPETSKVQKHQIGSFSLAGEDAKQLAAAMVQAAQIRAKFGDEVLGDFVRIPVDPVQEADYHAGQGLLPAEVRQVNETLDERAEERRIAAEQALVQRDSRSGSSGPVAEVSATEGALRPRASQEVIRERVRELTMPKEDVA